MTNRRDSTAIRLLLDALASSGALAPSRRSDERYYGLGVPPPPPYFDGGYMPEPMNAKPASSFIGFFPMLRKILWYFFVGVLLLISSLCLYGVFYNAFMPGLHASETLHFDYDGMPSTQQLLIPTRNSSFDEANTTCTASDSDSSNSTYNATNHVNNLPPIQQQQQHHQRQQGSPHALADLFSRQNQWEAHHPDIMPPPRTETRILPRRTPHYIEVLLDLPESERNRNMGMFGVLVELQSSNGTMLASSMRAARFPHESKWISVIRKGICIVPLMLGALQESRSVLVPSFRFFVESEELPLRYVTVNLIMPPEKAERQEVLEVLQGYLYIGRELTDFQQLLKDYFFTCMVFGTFFFYGLQVLLLLGMQWYWEYKREQRQREQMDLEDDASDNLGFDDISDNGGIPTEDDHDQIPVEVPIDEDVQDNNDINHDAEPGFFECSDEFDEGDEGNWEDLPSQNTENPSFSRHNVVETIPDGE